MNKCTAFVFIVGSVTSNIWLIDGLPNYAKDVTLHWWSCSSPVNWVQYSWPTKIGACIDSCPLPVRGVEKPEINTTTGRLIPAIFPSSELGTYHWFLNILQGFHWFRESLPVFTSLQRKKCP